MSTGDEYDRLIDRLTAKREELHKVNEKQALEIARLRAALLWFADRDKWLNEGRVPEWVGPGDEPWEEARAALANEQEK